MIQDLRYAFRVLAKNPGFATVAIVTLALGIGATSAIFSFVNAVVLRPLAVPNSDRLVLVAPLVRARGPFTPTSVTDGDFLEWQAQNHVFDAMTAFKWSTFSVTTGGDPERVLGANVTREFFDTIGVSAIAGRTFATRTRNANEVDVAVIGANLWRRRFNADQAAIGKPLILNGKPYTLIGVLPPGFTFPTDAFLAVGAHLSQQVEIWTPLEPTPGYRNNALNQVVARLKANVTLDQAQAEMSNIARAIDDRLAHTRGMGVQLLPLGDWLARTVRPLLFVLLGAVGFLLLIACTNVANLLLGRAVRRQREVAVRAALGSGRWRLIRQLLTESVVLSILGGLAGLLVAVWAIDAAVSFIPPGSLPRVGEVDLNVHALAFTLALSLASGMLFGLAPALHLSSPDITAALKSAGLTQTVRSRFFDVLVVAEVALAFVLLVGAGLLMKSFLRLTSVDPGFKPESVLTISVTLPEGTYATSVEMRRFAREALDGIHRVPGIVHAGAVNWLPLGGMLLSGDFVVEDVPQLPPGLVAAKPAVSADYFQAMGIPLRSGRLFTDRDTDAAPGVAIVSENLARQVWPGQSAVGKRIKVGFGNPAGQPWVSVVGIVGDVKQTALGDDTRPALYLPWEQAGRGADNTDRAGLAARSFLLRNLTFVIRTAVDPMSAAATVGREIRRLDASLPFDRIQTMRQWVADSVSEPRFRSAVFGSFAALAIALVGVGILGVIAHAVSRRTQEIGIRIALGAQQIDVLTLVVRHALLVTIAGIMLGAAAAAILTRLLAAFLYEVRPLDPATFLVAAVILIGVAFAASFVPARRASSVDPVVALRSE
jgi:putative ABC transport system permease protein